MKAMKMKKEVASKNNSIGSNTIALSHHVKMSSWTMSKVSILIRVLIIGNLFLWGGKAIMFSWIVFCLSVKNLQIFKKFFLGWSLMCLDVKDENLDFLIQKVVYYKGISTITPIKRYKLLPQWWMININNLLNFLLIMTILTILFTMTIRSLQNSVTHLGHFSKDFLLFTTFITLNLFLLIAFQGHVPRAYTLCWMPWT